MSKITEEVEKLVSPIVEDLRIGTCRYRVCERR